MRQLNKIIFLNSAHIPYKEIALDGNIHFIGTQGVGKSTVLRAILFFYNADKMKLGIPKEKQGFDSFYFPYHNSYIVYEVMRENGAYCIMAFKYKGRVAYRFIDSPYSSEWFIDKDNMVSGEWGTISKRIGANVSVSKIVQSYKMYLDIIFGNNRSRELLPFRKYAITESPNYRNIPRTIQNVFLNSKLDADFVKDTIIRSMSDEELSIDLDFYRSQIKEFEQEYNDMMLWFKKEKNGEVKIRRLADNVNNSFRDLKYTGREIKRLRGELGYAEKEARRQLPAMQADIDTANGEIKRHQRLISEERDKHRREELKLSGDLRLVEEKLATIKSKREQYARIGIDEIMRRVSNEPAVQRELKQSEDMKAALTEAKRNVVERYEALIARLEQNLRTFENEKTSAVLTKKNEASDIKDKLHRQLLADEEDVRAGFEDRQQEANNLIVSLSTEQARLRNNIATLAYKEPFKDEEDALQTDITALEARRQELEASIRELKLTTANIQQEYELKFKDVQADFEIRTAKVRSQQDGLKAEAKRLNDMRHRYSGSFAEWLDSNRPGWADDIGKIADEDAVLYNGELKPVADGKPVRNFFGIDIDCSAIDCNVLTPKELDRQIATLETSVRECVVQLVHIAEEQQVAEEKLKKAYGTKRRAVTDDQRIKEFELQQIPLKLKELKAKLQTSINKTTEWRKAQNKSLQEQLDALAHRMIEAEAARSAVKNELDRKLKTVRQKTEDKIKAVQKDVDVFAAQADADIEKQRAECSSQREELLRQQRHELEGKGVDMVALARCEDKINRSRLELEYISNNRGHVTLYENDKKELFDREAEFNTKRLMLKDKLSELANKFRQRSERYAAKLDTLTTQRDKLVKDKDKTENGLRQTEAFRADETFCPQTLDYIEDRPTRRSCGEIVEELKSQIISEGHKRDLFRKNTNMFAGYFSPGNVFNFRTEFVSDADYEDFATNLCEFIDNDKIDDYQQQISKRYVDILRRISKETGDITKRESDIQRTITGINNDFEKRNFAGVIKKIELRKQPSSDRLMQLLTEIKRFNDENQFNMGEQSLFADDNHEDVNKSAVRYLLSFMKQLHDSPERKRLNLADTFKLEFRVCENDNDTDWVEKIANVGSDGTDILVKAMVNIMLINVFKEQTSRKSGDFKLHCMMDEIGKLHPNNVKGILKFASSRNILLVNSSPTTYNVEDYSHTYLLDKDEKSRTRVVELIRTFS